jgi:hypothetical protein
MEEINAATQWMQIAAMMAQTGAQEALLAVEPTRMIDWIGDKLGVPAQVRRSTQERQDIAIQQQEALAATAAATAMAGGTNGMQGEGQAPA